MSLLNALKKSSVLRSFIMSMAIAMTATAALADVNLQGALNHIYRADTYMVQRDVNGSRAEILSAINDLQESRDRRSQDAITYLSQASYTIGFDVVRARDLLNSGELIVKQMIQSQMPSRQVLQDALDHIYVADDKIVHHDESSARSHIQRAIDSLGRYSNSDMVRATDYLRRSLSLVGRSTDQSRTQLNNAETIVERALGR